MSTKWEAGTVLVNAGGGKHIWGGRPRAECEANGWRAVEEPAPVERKLSPGWNWHTASGDDRCNKCHFVFAVGARFVCHGRGHGNCCGPCAETAGAFASPEPKAEVAKPALCGEVWRGRGIVCSKPSHPDDSVHCGKDAAGVTFAWEDVKAVMVPAPVVEKAKSLTCTFSTGCPGAASRRRIMVGSVIACDEHWLRREIGIAELQAADDAIRPDQRPRPAALPGTVAQVVGPFVGILGARGMR